MHRSVGPARGPVVALRSGVTLRSGLVLVLLTSGCALFGSLFGGNQAQPQQGSSGGSGSQDASAQREAELARQDEALQAEIQALWKEIDTEGVTSARALALTELTGKAFDSGAVQRGRVNGEGLASSTISHLGDAIAAEPDATASLELARGHVHTWIGQYDEAVACYVASLRADQQLSTFLEMLLLPHSPAVNAAVLEACPELRAQVDPSQVPDFVEACLAAAGGDSKRLEWKGVKKDLVAHRTEMDRRAEEERIRQEEERIRQEEERRRAEEEAAAAAALAAKQAQYTVAAVFAAGDCSFGDCMHKGWEIRTDEGTIRVTCNFGECLTKGWEARFPDGGTARTSCNFGECMTKGWETRFPDGETARTSCNFGECATKGWETRLPDGGTARTSCNFGECYTKGWETRLPDGGGVRCSCNFGDCLGKGTSCG
ncbi:hypothetical protein [Paraliomyxa miuraensis]|uniref:hypothetical protein n=1 Tax=Paraliomyxa miuraensis TaxID=376150 RepID=UPI0022523574|nr:hypothetical protein [Paraliomyxa miuraensis]MCX4246575.1 hypothetical protein [Paraliomyxa miuraensis]